MKTTNAERRWVFLILLLAGLVVGGLLGKFAENSRGLWWLNYGNEFGTGANGLTLDLNVLRIQFGFVIKITVSSIIGMLLSVVVYSWVVNRY